MNKNCCYNKLNGYEDTDCFNCIQYIKDDNENTKLLYKTALNSVYGFKFYKDIKYGDIVFKFKDLLTTIKTAHKKITATESLLKLFEEIGEFQTTLCKALLKDNKLTNMESYYKIETAEEISDVLNTILGLCIKLEIPLDLILDIALEKWGKHPEYFENN